MPLMFVVYKEEYRVYAGKKAMSYGTEMQTCQLWLGRTVWQRIIVGTIFPSRKRVGIWGFWQSAGTHPHLRNKILLIKSLQKMSHPKNYPFGWGIFIFRWYNETVFKEEYCFYAGKREVMSYGAEMQTCQLWLGWAVWQRNNVGAIFHSCKWFGTWGFWQSAGTHPDLRNKILLIKLLRKMSRPKYFPLSGIFLWPDQGICAGTTSDILLSHNRPFLSKQIITTEQHHKKLGSP